MGSHAHRSRHYSKHGNTKELSNMLVSLCSSFTCSASNGPSHIPIAKHDEAQQHKRSHNGWWQKHANGANSVLYQLVMRQSVPLGLGLPCEGMQAWWIQHACKEPGTMSAHPHVSYPCSYATYGPVSKVMHTTAKHS
jgi:hypothetical protein